MLLSGHVALRPMQMLFCLPAAIAQACPLVCEVPLMKLQNAAGLVKKGTPPPPPPPGQDRRRPAHLLQLRAALRKAHALRALREDFAEGSVRHHDWAQRCRHMGLPASGDEGQGAGRGH